MGFSFIFVLSNAFKPTHYEKLCSARFLRNIEGQKLSASKTDSGVAGARSGGRQSFFAQAQRNAHHAEIASISGGSPTAFERRILGTVFSRSKKSILNCEGQSLAAGTL